MATLAEQIREWYQLYQVKDGYGIIGMKNPSEKVQLAAVNQNPDAILHIENPSEEVQLAAVQQNGNYIQTISNPSERVQLATVNQHGYFIEAIDNPSERVQMVAIKEDLGNITLINSPCEAAQIYAVKHDPFVVSLIPTTEAVRILAVEQKPSVILHIENPSETLCKLAIEKEFPGAVISFSNPETTKKLFARLENINTQEERIQMFETLKNEYLVNTQARIEAIQVLQGNAPERVFEDRFKQIREQFDACADSFWNNIYDEETLHQYTNIRLMSDNIPVKNSIYHSARFFAQEIKDSFSPEELSKYANHLIQVDNLLVGKAVTIEELSSLFSTQYTRTEFVSAVFENEETGKYEFQNPYELANSANRDMSKDELILFDISKDGTQAVNKHFSADSNTLDSVLNRYGLQEIFDNIGKQEELYRGGADDEVYKAEIELAVLEDKLKITSDRALEQLNVQTSEYQYKGGELLHAGTHPYSPNYKEVFDKIGLKQEFNEFEKACCARSQWNDAYNYGIAAHDIAEIGNLERALPALDERVESSRSLIYKKISEIMNVKLVQAELLTAALSAYKESAFNLIDGLTTKIPTASAVEVQEINVMVIALSNPKTAFAIGEKADQYVSIFKELGVEQQFSDFREKWERLSQLCELSSDTNTANLTVEEKRLLLKEYVKADDAFESATMELISDIKDRKKLLAQPDISSISKASYADSNQSVGLQLANDSADKMKEQLRELGIPMSEQEKYITELLTFGRTNSLVPIQTSILNQEISALARLSIDINDNGDKMLKLHFIRKDLSSDLEQPFMGHYFSEEQKKNLISTQNAGEVIQITNTMGKSQLVLVSVDKLTGELVAQPVEKVMIPDTFRGVRLSDEDKLGLKAGQSVIVENVKAGKNTAYNIAVQYSTDFNKVVALADSNKITIVGGSRLSLKESEELRKGKTIQVSNMIDDKGEKYSAFVRIGYPKEEIFITPTNEHKVQVSHNNRGEKTEENKRAEKSRGQSPVKSGATQVKRDKRRIK